MSINETARERRQSNRADCCYQVELVRGDERVDASVINMGLGGIRFLATCTLQRGDCVELSESAMGLGPASVRVAWVRPEAPGRFEYGGIYHGPVDQLDPSWVKPALQRLGFEAPTRYERRRHQRANLAVDARLLRQDREIVCRLIDLGLGGALIQADEALPQGCVLKLEVQAPEALDGELLSGEPLAATLIYTRPDPDGGFRLGLAFEADRMTRAQARLVESYLQAMDH
jgi:hypothetical protein